MLEEQQSWQNRTLAPFYPFLFVDCLFVPIKRDYGTKECARAISLKWSYKGALSYGAPSLKACRVEFERFCQVWAKYPGAIAVWKRCFSYVEQLFEYPSAVRKNTEAVNSSFRKVIDR